MYDVQFSLKQKLQALEVRVDAEIDKKFDESRRILNLLCFRL
jgi:hypothetical protein